MESLPDAIVQYILSNLNNAKDVASCISVSKRWKDSMPYIRSLYFPRNIFDTSLIRDSSNISHDEIIMKIVSMVVELEELIVYCPFSGSGLESWLSIANKSLRHLELRMDSLSEQETWWENSINKIDCIGVVKNLESLKLWGVLMPQSPKWETFHNLRNLEIVGARMEDHTLVDALRLCPNLNRLLLLGCEGVRSVSINLKELEECKLDFYGAGNNSLSISCPKLTTLEIQGCGWMRVRETDRLRNLSISNSGGKVYLVDFGKLGALESLSLRGVQWCWDAISKMLQWASEVKHLFMKVEFTGDFENLLPFPEIDFVEFFNAHPKLQKFDIHGAMFAALCQKNSLKNVDSSFSIPCLEEVILTVRSPLNAEQKMSTLESFVKYAGNLKKMAIKILQMKSSHSSTDDFFAEVCRFSYMNRKIVRIE
ncbi:hypothetical protein BVRB_6g140760 [Beta vulgaris subsp. vulgaris]|uniref:F-box protein At1g10780 n=1 Tax=Beta vulgaris subsp. vulgaris TaxID=3555 RepID=UPI00053FC273|nr:F-box protein At1g10780 [Beta vulgaris subsp. vulgaris]KMT08398.1 hypothetical protein BVRB_6g140760 [Beta vulgaris subsp. vulgaris]